MKIYRNIAILVAAAASALACQHNEQVEFTLDSDTFNVGADGGSATVEVSSPGSWIASANVPWITVSPANGRGSQTCQIIVDSALVMKSAEEPVRRGTVTIEAEDWETRNISVTQENYGYSITLDKTEITVPDYEDLADRHFDVTVKSNTNFTVSYTDKNGTPVEVADAWITEVEDNPIIALTKGARPRNVTLRFDWDINQEPADRIAQVLFTPVDESGSPVSPGADFVTGIESLTVTQTSAAPKPDNARAADSTALVAISRVLNVWSGGWDTSTRMERWSDVVLWEEGDEYDGAAIPETWYGRVRYARFFMFNTDDGIPYQVSWLDAAETLIFYSNENYSIRENIKLGEAITKLPKLKRLTISAYGLDNESFPESFWTAFPNLEYLNLASNNFQYINEEFNQENFPKLHALVLRNNQKRTVYNLMNATTSGEQFAQENGGLYRENLGYPDPENVTMGGGFPVRLLKWDNLDTLELTLNYLEGGLPTDAQIRSYIGKGDWTHSDEVSFVQNGKNLTLSVADSLIAPTADQGLKDAAYAAFDALSIPKVLPKLRVFSINLNRFTGSLAPGIDTDGNPVSDPSGDTYRWLMFHPLMDWWEPSTFIFTQEGYDSDGDRAGFTDIPVNMDYYYNIYSNKKYAD